MKLRIVLAATAALALGACGKSGTTDAAATASAEASAPAVTEASAAATPAAVVAAAGAVPTKDYIVGKWAEEGGDCQHMVIQFNADGSMVGPFDKYELDNGVLTMVGNPQKMHLTVISPDQMESKLDGTEAPRKINRCK